MKYLSIIFLYLLSSLSFANVKSLTIGMIPGNGKEMQANANLLAKDLSKRLGLSVKIMIPNDYQGLVDAMKNKKVDFAFFTAMSFVYAEKEAGAKVLLKSVWDQPYYYSTMVSLKGSKVQSIQDLKGKRIGFVDEKSASGYLLPLLELQSKGIQKEDLQIVFTGNHKKSIDMLLNNEIDVAAVFTNTADGKRGAWKIYFPDQDIQVNKLWISSSIPTDPFTVRDDFYAAHPDLSIDVMMTLLELPISKDGKNILKDTIGITKLVTANSSQYEGIRRLVSSLPK